MSSISSSVSLYISMSCAFCSVSTTTACSPSSTNFLLGLFRLGGRVRPADTVVDFVAIGFVDDPFSVSAVGFAGCIVVFNGLGVVFIGLIVVLIGLAVYLIGWVEVST